MIVSFFSLSVYAQSAATRRNHFSTEGISFDYPSGYSVSDESTTETHQFIITRKRSSVQLTIISPRRIVLPDEMPAAADNLTEPIVKRVALTLGRPNSAGTPIQIYVGSRRAEGVRLRSPGIRKRTGEVIWLRFDLRLVAMSLVRANVDEVAASRLWQTVRSSLKVEAPVVAAMADADENTQSIKAGVLNGKALALPKPEYPAIARAAHASGTVVVQVLIDENGNVVEANAVSGHPLLRAVSVAAARAARFSPTLLAGMPVKVTGVIQYNFVAK